MQLNVTDIDLAGALTNVLETTAFLSPMPPEGEAAAPEMAQLASIDITAKGLALSLELVAGKGFALTLAANLLGTGPDDPTAEQQANDSVKELMNVTAGTIIPSLPDFPAAGYEMSIPRVGAFDVQTQWAAYTASTGVVVLDVEGQTVAARLRVR